MDTTTTTGSGFGARLLRALRNIGITVVVVACVGAAAYALALLNAKTYSVEIADGKLVVLKGKMWPWGADPWKPADPALADAYAPIELMGNNPVGLTQERFGDRDELDRALFGVIELLAKPRVESDDPKDLEQGLSLVQRAEKLVGLTEDQKTSRQRMRTEVAFYIARTRLEDAQRQVDEAIAQLKLAAQSDSRHAREATAMLQAVEPPAKALSDSMRAAVNTLSQPAGTTLTPPPPPPAPAPTDPTPTTVPTSPAPTPAPVDGATAPTPAPTEAPAVPGTP